MTQTQLKEKIEFYFDQDMVFSALASCEQLLQYDQTVYWQLQYADTLRLCGHKNKSLTVFLEIDPSNLPIDYQYLYHLLLGQLLMETGQMENAKTAFRACIAFKECDTVPFVFLASILSGEEKTEEAIAYLREALAKDGDIDEVYYNLATNYAVKLDFDNALNSIDRCLEIDPDFPNALQRKNDFLERKNIAGALNRDN
jgi:tetratricopeptide (TPR) repeat protein